jgi:hypothetical protein
MVALSAIIAATVITFLRFIVDPFRWGDNPA